MHKNSGNTLSEYAILLGLLAIISVTSLKFMGISISQLLGSSSSSSVENKVGDYYSAVIGDSKTMNFSGKSGSGFKTAGPSASGPSSRLATNNLSVGTNATSIEGTDVEVVQDKVKAFASILKALKEDPNHDSGVVEIVTRLADSGHLMGDELEVAFQDFAGSTDAFLGSYKDFYMSSYHFYENMGALDSYLAEHPGALPPELKQKADAAISELQVLTGNMIGAEGVHQEFWDKMVSDSNKHTAKVHQDSNTICKNGGDILTCVK